MSLKFNVKLFEKATKTVRKRLDSFRTPLDKPEATQMGKRVIDEMKDMISKGISPIRGNGRLPGYRGSYKERIIKDGSIKVGRRKRVSKRLRPVNLELTGDFLKKLKFRVRKLKRSQKITIGFFDKKSKLKEQGHREGANKQRKRPIIPEPPGEQFAQRIQDIILIFAGNFPISNIFDKSIASSTLNPPDIVDRPPTMGLFTVGADTTTSSSVMAISRLLSFAASVVISAQIFAP